MDKLIEKDDRRIADDTKDSEIEIELACVRKKEKEEREQDG